MESKIFAKLNFDPGILVILSLVLTVIMIGLVIFLLIRQSRLEMNYKMFMKGKTGKSLEEAFRQELDNMDQVHEQTELLHKRMLYVEKSLNKSYQKLGIVRYDAFKELGGKLSFAYAMLNDSDSGFVMNCIHSREGSYTYIKEVVRGECNLQLSNEEAEAIQRAISGNSVTGSKITKNDVPEAEENVLDSLKNRVKLPNTSSFTEKLKKRTASMKTKIEKPEKSDKEDKADK